MIEEEFEFINPQTGDSMTLYLENLMDTGVWRVYFKGDRQVQPLDLGPSREIAKRKFDLVKTGLLDRIAAGA